jgi:AbrB family looped-hinge helix DNA binding protein
MKTVVSAKGQVVIPKKIRDQLRLRPGDRLIVQVVGDGVLLRPERPELAGRLFGRYRGLSLTAELEAEHRAELDRDSRRG